MNLESTLVDNAQEKAHRASYFAPSAAAAWQQYLTAFDRELAYLFNGTP